MAYSLEVEPARHLFHTLRTRSFGALIQCDPAAYASCVEPSCPVKHVVDFLAKQKCTIQSCNVSQADLLRKTEQKLVDTMLTSDLLFFATLGQRELIVVSSDDDLWPGIRTALGIGASVTLVHTRPTRTLPGEYTRGLPMSFKQLAL
jgi:hypothetical protein